MQSGFRQFIKFGLVGISNTLISEGVYFVIVLLGGNYVFAYAIGFILSVLNAYYWSNKYVFKEDENAEKRVWWKVLLKTYAAYLWGFAVSTVLLIFWVDIVKISRFMYPVERLLINWGVNGVNSEMLGKLLASPLSMAVTIPMNFFTNKYWAYRQKKNSGMQETESCGKHESRLANLELLRIVSMMLIVVLHFLWKGECLFPLSQSVMPFYGYVAWGIEAFAIVSLNAYMMLSGYFLIESSFKVKRLLGLILQLMFYSIVIGLVAAAFGYVPAEGFSVYYMVQLCLPVSTNHYWFMTVYVFIYLLSPMLSRGIKSLTKRQFQTVLFLFFIIFSVIKSVTPIRLAADMGGYDCIWYVCVFMAAAYVRLYGLPFFKNTLHSLLAYLIFAAGTSGGTFLLRYVYLHTGKLKDILDICYDHNHIFTLAASIAFFCIFYHMKIANGTIARIICRISPYTLGVYLLHEHLAIRYEWTGWLYNLIGKPDSAAGLIIDMLIAIAVVFVAGVLVDMLRSLIFKGLHKLLLHIGVYMKLEQWLDSLTIGTSKGDKKEDTHE